MFNFGKPSYIQLNSVKDEKPHGNGISQAGSSSLSQDTWARAEGDVDVERGGTGAAAPGGAGAGQAPASGGESGRVQIPIGMVTESTAMRRSQTFALVAFTLINVGVIVGLFVLGLCLTGLWRVAVVAVGGGGWLALLLFNVRMAARPRRIIQSFLHRRRKTRLSHSLRNGSTVVVKGAVSLLHEELLSTEFHNVPGLVLVESSLRSYHPGLRKADAWTEHVRQTRAVDFRITDSLTGTTAIVRAFNASETGAATPLVHISTEVPLSTAVPVSPSSEGIPPAEGTGPKPVETEESRRRKKMVNPQLMVCKGYIRQGQVITVMGQLQEQAGSPELYITALPQPHNIAKLLLYRGFVPFFFPTWVSGLVISDQRDLI